MINQQISARIHNKKVINFQAYTLELDNVCERFSALRECELLQLEHEEYTKKRQQKEDMKYGCYYEPEPFSFEGAIPMLFFMFNLAFTLYFIK